MTSAPESLPSGLIADPHNANHRNVLTSRAPAQVTRPRLVTRRTPVNFAVCCLIDLIQRENAAASPVWARHFPDDPDGLYLAMLHGQQRQALAEAIDSGRAFIPSGY